MGLPPPIYQRCASTYCQPLPLAGGETICLGPKARAAPLLKSKAFRDAIFIFWDKVLEIVLKNRAPLEDPVLAAEFKEKHHHVYGKKGALVRPYACLTDWEGGCHLLIGTCGVRGWAQGGAWCAALHCVVKVH